MGGSSGSDGSDGGAGAGDGLGGRGARSGAGSTAFRHDSTTTATSVPMSAVQTRAITALSAAPGAKDEGGLGTKGLGPAPGIALMCARKNFESAS